MTITFVWVPGAWHGPEGFHESGQILEQKGYKNVYVNHKSVGVEKGLKDPADDVKNIRAAIEGELEQGNDVIIVMHSYGGVPSSNAAEGLGKKDRKAAGKSNGIVNMVWVCSFALPKGVTLWNGLNNTPLPWFDMSRSETDGVICANQPEEIFYNDCSVGQQIQYKAALRPHSANTFDLKVEYEAYKRIPSSYLICDKDNAIPQAAQEGMIKGAGPEAFQIVEHLDASHSPFISKPGALAEFLLKVADKSA